MPSDYKKLYAVYVLREVFFFTYYEDESFERKSPMEDMIKSKALTEEYAESDMQDILEWLDCK